MARKIIFGRGSKKDKRRSARHGNGSDHNSSGHDDPVDHGVLDGTADERIDWDAVHLMEDEDEFERELDELDNFMKERMATLDVGRNIVRHAGVKSNIEMVRDGDETGETAGGDTRDETDPIMGGHRNPIRSLDDLSNARVSVRSEKGNENEVETVDSVQEILVPPVETVTKSEESGNASTSADASANEDKQDDKDDGKSKKKNRCGMCRKKVGLTGFECRCGGLFCAIHRYSDKHECSFDYRELGAQEIRRNNPVVVGEKIQKI